MADIQDMTVEQWTDAKPGEGRVFAAVFPHSDDFTIFTGGLITKLLREGYKGYFIRTTNDMVDSLDGTPGETMRDIEAEMANLVKCMGIEQLYDFNYMNHYLDHSRITELRHRLMTVFRIRKVDTVISFDPSGHHEENPDHYITALAVEQACWMAGSRMDLMELGDAGIEPCGVRQKYYISRWPAQYINRVIDISPVVDYKVRALMCNYSPMKKMCGSGDLAVMERFIREHFIDNMKPLMGLTHYEAYYHIGG